MFRSAVLSTDKVFRYTLVRRWNDKQPTLVVLMLNPSTADGMLDDRTILKCIWLAASWHYGSIVVVNFCAYRATKPAVLFAALKAGQDVVGGQNYNRIANVVLGRDVLCAWGANVRRLDPGHVERVHNILRRHARKLVCLNTTLEGYPVHPLYQRKDSKPKRFSL